MGELVLAGLACVVIALMVVVAASALYVAAATALGRILHELGRLIRSH